MKIYNLSYLGVKLQYDFIINSKINKYIPMTETKFELFLLNFDENLKKILESIPLEIKNENDRTVIFI